MATLLNLAKSFFLYTVLTFGNGPIMIPLLQKDFVENQHLINQAQLLYAFTIARVTPGQANLYVAAIGYMVAGMAGAIVSMIAILLPGYVMLVFMGGYERFKNRRWVAGLTRGLTATSVGLILAATWDIAASSLVDTVSWIVFAATVIFIQALKMNVLLALLAASLLGLVLKTLFPGL